MSENNNSKVSPIVAIAATSVTLFSLVGIGVLTGVIPSSYSKDAEMQAAATAPVESRTAPRPAAHKSPHVAAASDTAQRTTPPARIAAADTSKPAVRAACGNCATIASVRVVEQKGEGTGLGAVAGGVLGGVLGNQVGRGNGRTIATVAGAAGGALAGNEVEKRVKTERHYVVTARMEDGGMRDFTYQTEPPFQAGDVVKIIDGQLVR